MVDSLRFQDRVALVTGAASGIGRATASRLADEGALVAVVDVDPEGSALTVAAIMDAGKVARSFVCDVTDGDAIEDCVGAIEERLGPIDVLANVAGVGDTADARSLEVMTNERWDYVLAVNLGGPFRLCRAVVPGMAQRGRGAVVNVSSLAGRSKSANGGVAYTSSKAGLLGLTRHLAFDYGPYGVRVNAICPGGVDTPMIRAAAASQAATPEEAEARALLVSAYTYFMPIKRLSSPEEQAAAITFLASDDASYINGASLDVNGGLFMA
ncbi:MAG: SDR family NAD(P)-dependent oxidoreductase [Candidatus Binatia bacterium]